MDVNELIRTISLIVAPAVMISCCTVFLNGQMQRYDAIGSRMRLMNQERFEILRVVDNSLNLDPDTLEGVENLRISEIEAQLPHLLNRYKLLRDAALMIGLSILLFVICMFVIALATIMHSNIIAVFSLVTFLLGTIMVFIGGIMVMLEIYKSHLSVRYEVLHALSSGKKTPTLTLPHRVLRVPRFSN
jgi:hypothetical protein